jgi:IS30 family transposase
MGKRTHKSSCVGAVDAYSCNPQSPWQRGSNANTNGLLRRYIPKGTDLSVHSHAYLNKVARQLNEAARRQDRFRLAD